MSYTCKECNLSFFSRDSLEVHIERSHKKSDPRGLDSFTWFFTVPLWRIFVSWARLLSLQILLLSFLRWSAGPSEHKSLKNGKGFLLKYDFDNLKSNNVEFFGTVDYKHPEQLATMIVEKFKIESLRLASLQAHNEQDLNMVYDGVMQDST